MCTCRELLILINRETMTCLAQHMKGHLGHLWILLMNYMNEDCDLGAASSSDQQLPWKQHMRHRNFMIKFQN